jgi:hypothetical protein
MNKCRFFIGLLLVAMLVMFVPASHAANCQSAGSTINCQIIAVGSSAMFTSAGIAAVSSDPTTGRPPICNTPGAGTVTHFWTGAANGRDGSPCVDTPEYTRRRRHCLDRLGQRRNTKHHLCLPLGGFGRRTTVVLWPGNCAGFCGAD